MTSNYFQINLMPSILTIPTLIMQKSFALHSLSNTLNTMLNITFTFKLAPSRIAFSKLALVRSAFWNMSKQGMNNFESAIVIIGISNYVMTTLKQKTPRDEHPNQETSIISVLSMKNKPSLELWNNIKYKLKKESHVWSM